MALPPSVPDLPDLLGLAAELCAVPSVSHEEAALADLVEARLRVLDGLAVERIGDNVVARTTGGHGERVVLAGHLDTVPPAGNAVPRVEGGILTGLGAADMKGGLAVMLALAEVVARRPSGSARRDGSGEADRRFDLSLVFYAGEEVADEHNGLRHLFAERPDLVRGDLAVLLEPTGGWAEAGCQGTIHVRATFGGRRAHSARPWTGVNAVHRAVPALERLVAAAGAAGEVTVDGLPFRESLQVVRIEAGVANNVVPDECTVVVNRRFAPSRDADAVVRDLEALLGGADAVEVINLSPAAPPALSAPLVAELVGVFDLAVRPKLGWTDVARFASHGIPALNFGPGEPSVAHSADESVTSEALEGVFSVLARFLGVL